MNPFAPYSPWDYEARTGYEITRHPDNPVPFPDWANNLVFGNVLKAFISRVPNDPSFPSVPYFESLYLTPKSIRYQIDTAGRVTHPGVNLTAWRVELARFVVPQRYIGIIRGFEQFMGVVGQSGVNGIISYGNPFSDTDAGVEGRWCMRLFAHSGEIRPWINTLTPTEFQPGIPYSDFAQQSGIWYPAHSDAANSIRLPVPGGYELSVFWECDDTISARPVVGAAFKGGIQSAIDSHAMDHYLGTWS